MESPIPDQSIDSDTISNMREVLHNMKLQDAIHRQNIWKLEWENKNLETESAGQQKTLNELNKQKSIDEQYLIKQQELIFKIEMAAELGERPTDTENLKEQIKE